MKMMDLKNYQNYTSFTLEIRKENNIKILIKESNK